MAWVYLVAAIVCEVFATTMMKASDGFSRLWPSIGMVAGYLVAFVLLTFALKTMQVGTAYALWAGLGTALVAVIGMLVFAEPFNLLKGAGLVLVIGGVVLLNLAGGH